MKSYTDLEQSKKLTEILSPDSADMIIVSIGDREGVVTTTMPKETFNMLRTPFTDVRNTISCWSLAALLELLPKRIEIVDNVYELSVYLYGIYYWNINNGNLCFELKDKDNLVDACYEAIVFLHEQKLSLYRMNKK